jgi:hypothetical protein
MSAMSGIAPPRKLIFCLLVATGYVSPAWAQTGAESFDFGRREYVSNCSGCHGPVGRGDGAFKPFLNTSPSDLTRLSQRNQGRFPQQRIYRTIDGRQEIRAHLGGDMPIWGADYLTRYASDYADVPYDPESYVRTRIAALVDYLNRIQVK